MPPTPASQRPNRLSAPVSAHRSCPVFGMAIHKACSSVPSEILYSRNTWADKQLYDDTAGQLADWFISHLEKYAEGPAAEILAASPKK